DLGGRVPRERAPVVAVQLRGGARRGAPAALRRARGRGGGAPGEEPAPAGVRPVTEVVTRVQPAGRARRGLGHGAGRLYRTCPEARAPLRPALRGERWRRSWLRSAARSCPPPRAARPSVSCRS